MQNTLRQEQQQTLQQRLNPQSVALGRLLEMSVPQFEEEIRRELDDNPALEASYDDTAREHDDFRESADDLMMADYADADDVPTAMRARRDSSAYFDPTTTAADNGASMLEVLMNRLKDDHDLSPDQARIAVNILGNLDDNGYLTRSLREIANDMAFEDGFEATPAQMDYVYGLIRGLDPAGIAARDLRDCLLLQLERKPRNVTVATAQEILEKHFDAFAKKHYDRLQAQLEISRTALAEALDLIRTLNPRPGAGLGHANGDDTARHVSPDIVLDYDVTTDTFTISLAGNIPELSIEESFSASADEGLDDGADKNPSAPGNERRNAALAFIRRKRDDATAFIKLVKMRTNTLMAIAKAIVEIQRDFFISGDTADIKPMILRDIEARTGLGLSVISRATTGKYILAPHGIYPLKMFFNERPDAESDASQHRILNALAALIDAENPHAPLSDRRLCDALAQQGYNLARRTVAKYRERLGKPVARLRKRL